LIFNRALHIFFYSIIKQTFYFVFKPPIFLNSNNIIYKYLKKYCYIYIEKNVYPRR